MTAPLSNPLAPSKAEIQLQSLTNKEKIDQLSQPLQKCDILNEEFRKKFSATTALLEETAAQNSSSVSYIDQIQKKQEKSFYVSDQGEVISNKFEQLLASVHSLDLIKAVEKDLLPQFKEQGRGYSALKMQVDQLEAGIAQMRAKRLRIAEIQGKLKKTNDNADQSTKMVQRDLLYLKV